MSESTAGLRKKITAAGDLQSVVRAMKAVAASSVGQYEQSVRALDGYYRAVELGLGACFRESGTPFHPLQVSMQANPKKEADQISALVFGSDQGLVGQFNDVVADFAARELAPFSSKIKLWAVGERVRERLSGMNLAGSFRVATSIQAVTPLVAQILMKCEKDLNQAEGNELHLFYNHPTSGSEYIPTSLRLLPLDESWLQNIRKLSSSRKELPQIIGPTGGSAETNTATLRAFIHEYLFISIFRACAESLASENASRLAAMQRADKNIEELLDDLNGTFHRTRQNNIDEELFDVVSGFEALKGTRAQKKL